MASAAESAAMEEDKPASLRRTPMIRDDQTDAPEMTAGELETIRAALEICASANQVRETLSHMPEPWVMAIQDMVITAIAAVLDEGDE